uniref:Uncharacterized protein n=1 Tax=Oryza barthii TaxID=65489 RepID=A0A0D3G3J2_9ORYZ
MRAGRLVILVAVAVVVVVAGGGAAEGAGECGRASADRVALRLAPLHAALTLEALRETVALIDIKTYGCRGSLGFVSE